MRTMFWQVSAAFIAGITLLTSAADAAPIPAPPRGCSEELRATRTSYPFEPLYDVSVYVSTPNHQNIFLGSGGSIPEDYLLIWAKENARFLCAWASQNLGEKCGIVRYTITGDYQASGTVLCIKSIEASQPPLLSPQVVN